MGEVGSAYAACRGRIGDLVRDLEEERAAAPVPTCPEWSVHDVVAHVAGVVDDALAGRLEGVGTDPWTAAQVAARRERSIPDIVAEWNRQAPDFEGILDAIGPPGRQAVFDLATHEHDLRFALGQPGARDTDAVQIGAGFVLPNFVAAATEDGTPVRVREANGPLHGDGDGPVLTGTPFALFRTLTGRRTLDQIRAMQWEGDPEPALAAFTWGPFRPATETVEE